MSLTTHEMSAGLMSRMLTNLVAVLEKGRQHAVAKGQNPDDLLQLRLAEDMFPLVRQIQIATDSAKGCVARLAGQEAPAFADDETTYAQIEARIQKTLAYIASVPAAAIEAGADRDIVLKQRTRTLEFKGRVFLAQFALPNFFFHVTTAYDLLRAHGVEIGKNDYLGAF